VVEFGYGSTYARNEQLADKPRQLATISALVAMGGCESQLDIHFAAALKMGISPQDLIELLQHLSAFCGFPRVLNASARLRNAIENMERRA
jgi:4-carboxymuconolactone decarboxylase